MAWNEPGKGEQNPWGKKNDGADQLEESIKRFKKKLDALLNSPTRRASSKGGPHLPVGGGGSMILVIAGMIGLLWVLLGIFIVAPAEKAVILRFGKYTETLGPGPHWIPRFIETKHIVNEQKIASYSYQADMLTRDENIVSVDVAVPYRISDAKTYLFNVVDPIESLQQATASSLRQVVGNTTLEMILTKGRNQVRQEVQDQLVGLLGRYHTGLTITNVALQPAKAPEAVKEAFDDAINAQEDEKRFKEQAETEAKTFQQQAIGSSQRLLIEAKAYQEQVILTAKADTASYQALLPEYQRSPRVTRERLYMDAMQSVLEKTTKMLIDVNAGNSVFYLPLDKIINRDQANDGTPATNLTESTQSVVPPYRIATDSSRNSNTTIRPDRSSLLEG